MKIICKYIFKFTFLTKIMKRIVFTVSVVGETVGVDEQGAAGEQQIV